MAQKFSIIEIRLPRQDHKSVASQLTEIPGVGVDTRDGEGHYSPYYDKALPIEQFILFPINIFYPIGDKTTVIKIRDVIGRYLLSNETAIAIINMREEKIILHGPLDSITKENIFDPLFDKDII